MSSTTGLPESMLKTCVLTLQSHYHRYTCRYTPGPGPGNKNRHPDDTFFRLAAFATSETSLKESHETFRPGNTTYLKQLDDNHGHSHSAKSRSMFVSSLRVIFTSKFRYGYCDCGPVHEGQLFAYRVLHCHLLPPMSCLMSLQDRDLERRGTVSKMTSFAVHAPA